MVTQTRRLAMVTAMLWFGFGGGGPAEAALALQTPAGLTPGETFRFVFVTDGSRDALSSDIADYNSFVNTQAGGATYNGNVVPWFAIASTFTFSAIDNVPVSPDPVFLADGTKVTTATDTTGLWSGTLLHQINEDLTSQQKSSITPWTGTNQFGTTVPAHPLGEPARFGLSTAGSTDATDTTWVQFNAFPNGDQNPLYGISAALTVPPTVVPEPSTLRMAVTAISAGLAYGWSLHRRDQRRQRPVGPPDATE